MPSKSRATSDIESEGPSHAPFAPLPGEAQRVTGTQYERVSLRTIALVSIGLIVTCAAPTVIWFLSNR